MVAAMIARRKMSFAVISETPNLLDQSGCELAAADVSNSQRPRQTHR